jgi:hypothetical protein
MRSLHLFSLLAASIVLFYATPNVAHQMCEPTLAVNEARISEAWSMQRTWTAVLTVDVSHCSTTSGQFEIEFTRLKESAPDMQFTERFTWLPGKTKISLDVWWDEWLENYRVARIAPCSCRN